ncbi:MAG: tape measure protein [Firmicutes bacterium]|nr:tape measure protein [Bacillota bacterium]
MNVGTLTVRLVASATEFERAMRQAAQTMTGTVKVMRARARELESISNSMMVSMTLPLSLAGAAAIRLAGDMEQTRIAFTNMLGSAQRANEFLRQLQDFAARTPFEFTQLTDASRRLLAFGFSARDVIPMLTAVGDAVAAMGGSADMLDRVILAIGQIQAKGRVQADEMLQLTEAGIPAWRFLADAMGVTTQQVVKMTEQGLIPADKAIRAILQGMESQAPGMMAQQSRTLNGAFSNLIDVLKQTGVTIGDTIAGTLRLADRVRALTEWLQRAADAFAAWPPWLRSFTVWLGVAALAAGPLLRVIGAMSNATAVAVQGAALLARVSGRAAFAFASWQGGAAKLSEALLYFAGSRLRLVLIGMTAVVAVGLLVATHWRQLAGVAQSVWHVIGGAALYGASLVVRGAGLILSGIAVIVPPLRGTASAVMGLADQLRSAAMASFSAASNAAQEMAANQMNTQNAAQAAAKGQEQLAQAAQDAAKAAQDNIQSFDQVHQLQDQMAASAAAATPAIPGVDLSGLSGGLGGVADLAGAITGPVQSMADGLASAWQRVLAALKPVNEAISWIGQYWPAIGPIVEGIASVLSVALIPALIKTGVEATVAGAKLIWAWLTSAAEAMGAVVFHLWAAGVVVAGWVRMAAQAVASAAQVVWAWIVQGWQAAASVAVQVVQFGILAARWLWTAAVATASAVRMAAAWFVALGPVGWAIGVVALIAAVVATHWDQVVAWTEAAWTTVSTWVSHTWDNLRAWAGERFAAVRDAIAGAWDSVKSSTVDLWNGIRDWLSGAWSSIRDRVASVWGGIKDTVLGVWRGIWDGIKGWINAIIDAINGLIRGLNRVHFSAPNWVPVIGGMSWGFNLPEIPRLAQGGIVDSPTLALVGERGPEAVVPLGRDNALADSIAQAVYTAVRDALRVSQAASPQPGMGDREIVLRIDGRTFARAVLPAVIAEGQRQGLQLVVRPQGV